MTNRKSLHRQEMFSLLKYLYTGSLGSHLGFKGGTALYFFHQLPRFSVDLDFDLIAPADSTLQDIQDSLEQYCTIKGHTLKQDGTLSHSHRRMVQYGGAKKLKVEISTFDYPDYYSYESLLGSSIQVMDIRWMFAHKLCAFISRYHNRQVIANRDLFDIIFLLGKHIQPTSEIIAIRSEKMTGTAMNTREWYQHIIAFMKTHETTLRKDILNGLGELIDHQGTKHHLKEKLFDEMMERLGLAAMG